jgi:flavin-dependent dehydrogenase
MYDVAIAGGGPAGLMAAKTAAERGLKTVLLEKRPGVGTITRACCQQFIMDEGYEGETITVGSGKITFQNNGFDVPYSGPLFGVQEKRYISPGGHAITFSHADGRPLAVQFDKGRLLQILWDCCAAAGVELISGATVFDASDQGGSVAIDYMRSGSVAHITAGKIICADGVTSRSAAALGLNQSRKYILSSRAMCYVLENVRDDTPFVMKSFIGNVYESQGPVILYPYLNDPTKARLFVAGTKSKLPDAVLAHARARSCLKAYLEHARVLQKTGCGLRVHTPLASPCSGNALVIGDAAAYVEVETQGALMCGYKSAVAVRDELDGKDGFARYNDWWRSSFEFNGPDVAMVAQGYVLVPVYTDDELDYLFGLTAGETLPGSYSQYRTPKYMWDAILKHADRIAREHPALLEKISNNMHLSLKNVLLI